MPIRRPASSVSSDRSAEYQGMSHPMKSRYLMLSAYGPWQKGLLSPVKCVKAGEWGIVVVVALTGGMWATRRVVQALREQSGMSPVVSDHAIPIASGSTSSDV